MANQLLEALISQGLLAKKDAAAIEEKVKTTGKMVDELLLQENLVAEETFYKVKSDTFRFLLRPDPPEDVSPQILSKIPEDTAQYYKMVPLGEDEGFLEVGMLYPEDIKAQEALRFLGERKGFLFRQYLITPSIFDKVVKRYRTLKTEIEKAVTEFEKESREGIEDKKEKKVSLLEEITEEAPVSKVVAVLLSHAVEGGASDIHIEPQEGQLRVRFRFNGLLYSSIVLPLKIHPAVVARIKILAGLRLDETRIPQDGKIHMNFEKKKIDIRVAVLPTTNGEKVALRILDPTVGLRRFEDLGVESRNLAALQKAISKPFGFILVAGPTGSGKTTTLYAMMNTLDKERNNIVTLEDPVEYIIEGVNQSQVFPEIDYTFATGLRHILRQDPDIIMVGEIRDKETANLAIHAALTGHLMFSTIHTNNAFGIIPRLINLGIEAFLIPPAISLMISQRLVPRLCEHCKKKELANPKITKILKDSLGDIPGQVFEQYGVSLDSPVYYSTGCKKCMFLKFSGRIGIFETFEMTKELAAIILKEGGEGVFLEEAKRQGFISMRQDGLLKALRGIVSVEAVIRETEE